MILRVFSFLGKVRFFSNTVFFPQSQAMLQPQSPLSAPSIPSKQPYQQREKNVLKLVDPNTGKNILKYVVGGTATRQTPPQSGSSSARTTPVSSAQSMQNTFYGQPQGNMRAPRPAMPAAMGMPQPSIMYLPSGSFSGPTQLHMNPMKPYRVKSKLEAGRDTYRYYMKTADLPRVPLFRPSFSSLTRGRNLKFPTSDLSALSATTEDVETEVSSEDDETNSIISSSTDISHVLSLVETNYHQTKQLAKITEDVVIDVSSEDDETNSIMSSSTDISHVSLSRVETNYHQTKQLGMYSSISSLWSSEDGERSSKASKATVESDGIQERREPLNNSIHTAEDRISSLTNSIISLKINIENIVKTQSNLGIEFEEFEKKSEGRFKDLLSTTNMESERSKEIIESLKAENRQLRDQMNEMKTKSMQNNLLFLGIAETESLNRQHGANSIKSTEELLTGFIKSQLGIATDISFERVHRLGKKRRKSNSRHRPIVAKFTFYKQREEVRLSAPRLKGTAFNISEQFPTEILNVRRQLYPKFREAKKQGFEARLVADKLFINGKQVLPDSKGLLDA